MRLSTRALALLYGCLGSIRLLYLPYSLPVMDDWSYLRVFDRARAGGLAGVAHYLHALLANSEQASLRVYWASYDLVFALWSVAGAAGWPYCLLAWLAHLSSAVLLCRIVSHLARNDEAGFLAGAVFAVFPACNNVLFAALAAVFYYTQVLAFAAWFYWTWRKLARGDFRYRWTDLAALGLVIFTGEQILAPLVLLLPLTWWLAGSVADRPRFLRYWLTHAAAALLLVGSYILFVNSRPLSVSVQARYDTTNPWTLRHLNFQLNGALGLVPEFAGWRPAWRLQPQLLVPLALGVAAFLWGLRKREEPQRSARAGELLLWSVAGTVLAYLPVARLASPAPRHLYAPSFFLVPAGVGLLMLMPRPARRLLATLCVMWGIAYTEAEIRQCWIPQSRVAQSILDALAQAPPFTAGETVILSGGRRGAGPAPAFLNGASWSLRDALARYTSAEGITAARDLVVAEDGTLALFQGDAYLPFSRADFGRLRVLAAGPEGRVTSRPVVAVPELGGGYRLSPLRSFSDAQPPPATVLHFAELSQLTYFEQIYFASRISSHDLPAQVRHGRP